MKLIKHIVSSCVAVAFAFSLTGCAERKPFAEALRDMTCLSEYDYNVAVDISGYDAESSDALNMEFSGKVDCTGAYSVVTAPVTVDGVTAPSMEIISSSNGDLYINTHPFFELLDESVDEMSEELTSIKYLRISAEEPGALGEYYGVSDTSSLVDTQSVSTAAKSIQAKTIDFLDIFFTKNSKLLSFDNSSYIFDCNKEKFDMLLQTLSETVEDGSLESYLNSIKEDILTVTGQTEEAANFDPSKMVNSVENYLDAVNLDSINSLNLNISLAAPTHKDNSYKLSMSFDGSKTGDDSVSFAVSCTMTPTTGEDVTIPEKAISLSDAVERLNAVYDLSTTEDNAEDIIDE